MEVLDTLGSVLRINAPEWFALPAFRDFLHRGTDPAQKLRVATFHRHGDEPNAWSDVFVPFEAFQIGVDEHGKEVWDAEGSDIFGDEALTGISQVLIEAAKDHYLSHGVIWISNLS